MLNMQASSGNTLRHGDYWTIQEQENQINDA